MMRAVTEPQVSENKFGRSRCPSKRGARQEGAFHIVCMCVCVREGGASHVSGEEADTVLPGSLCGGAAAAGRCVRVGVPCTRRGAWWGVFKTVCRVFRRPRLLPSIGLTWLIVLQMELA